MPPSEDARRILQILTALIGMRGLRLRDLEGSIGLSAGTLRRVLNGTIELKFRHITDLLAVLDIPTKTFFRIVFDSKDPEQAQLHLAQAVHIGQFEPKPVMLDRREIEAVVLATMKRLGFDRQADDLDEIGPEASQNTAPTTPEPPKPMAIRKKPVKKKDEDPDPES